MNSWQLFVPLDDMDRFVLRLDVGDGERRHSRMLSCETSCSSIGTPKIASHLVIIL